MRRRFFVDRFETASAELRGDAAEHLGRVLRAEAGQLYELSDGQNLWLGRIARVALSKRGDSRVEFALVEQLPASGPGLQIEVLLALIKFDRFEWCIEKATELGASEITPLCAARSDKPLIAAAQRRLARWEKIALESAQQSRRLRPPVMHAAVSPEAAFASSSARHKIFLSERREASSLRAILVDLSPAAGIEVNRDQASSASLAIGPEGGWTDAEIAAARAAGFVEASLGENILRTETAVLASMAILGFALTD